MDIWQYYKAINRRLLVWSIVSVIAGAVLLVFGALWQGVGLQAIAWGAIDAGIALIGGWVTRRRRAGLADPSAPEVLIREARNLRRILLINTGLDVLYITGGVILAHRIFFGAATAGASSSRAGSCSFSICSTPWHVLARVY
jgi:hypothetical protein